MAGSFTTFEAPKMEDSPIYQSAYASYNEAFFKDNTDAQLQEQLSQSMAFLKSDPSNVVYNAFYDAILEEVKRRKTPKQPPIEKTEEGIIMAATATEERSPWTRLIEDIELDVSEKLDGALKSKTKQLDKEIKEMRNAIRDNVLTLKVEVAEMAGGNVTGLRHNQLEQLIQVVAQSLPVLLVGMAGTGKTHAGQQVAEAMDLPFFAMSVGAQTSKSDIMGYMHAGGDYVRTHFREAFENGGVFLMDEIDAGNANVLIQVNAALSNNYCAFPDAMIQKHENFRFIASANTFGNGANRQYVGRNQLDAATLDRFTLIEWNIDDKLEAMLAGESDDQKRWYNAVREVRSAVEKEGLRVVVSPRATLRGSTLLAAGLDVEAVSEMALLKLFPNDKHEWAKETARKAYAKRLVK